MTTEQTIPLSKLVHCPVNVRRTGRLDGIAGLAASIAAHGLRQNLNVRPHGDGKHFEVVAGGRRLRALKRLAKEGRLPRNAPVACRLLGESDDPAEIGLAENTLRLAMHPDDQCDAFRALIDDKAMSVDDVAARFGIAPTLVRQRLKLAGISPTLRALYRKGELTLEHMTALSLSDDHAAQEKAWRDLPEWNHSPLALRRSLTAEAVPVTDKLARLVGIEAYEAAGGNVLRDLFDPEAAFLADRPLVERLAAEAMAETVAAVQAEGWKWVEPRLNRDYATPYGRVYPVGDLGGTDYADDDRARAGAVVHLDHDGTLSVERGLVHPDDVEKPQRQKAAASSGGLASALVEDLTAHRTAALRLALARNPGVALAAAVHAIALPLLYPYAARSCLALRAVKDDLSRHTKHPGDSPAHAAMAEEATRWGDRLPGDPADLFAWCLGEPQEVLLDLLAYVSALTVDAVRMHYPMPHKADATDRLATALALDMREWWSPSVEGFFARLPKAALAKAVEEAGVAPVGVSLMSVGKAEAARLAAQALAGSGWLPEPLRPVD